MRNGNAFQLVRQWRTNYNSLKIKEGVTGKVARISGQQRVVVEISGLCLVATAYIPNGFLETVQNQL